MAAQKLAHYISKEVSTILKDVDFRKSLDAYVCGIAAICGGGGGAGNTIYTADDSLVGDRIVDGATHILTFQNLLNFNINSNFNILSTATVGNAVSNFRLDPSDGGFCAGLDYINSDTDVQSVVRFGDADGSISFSKPTAGTSAIVQLSDTQISTIFDDGVTSASVIITATDVRLKPLGFGSASIGDVFTLADPTTGAGEWHNPGTFEKTVLNDYYSLPSNFSTQSTEAITKSGATATATITAAGPYDKFVVTGGDQTSFVQFTKVNRADNNVKAKLRVKINTKGTTACLIGLGWEGFNSTQDTGSTSANKLYVNLTSGVVFEYYPFVDSVPVALTTYKQTGTFAVSGDIVEIEYITDTFGGFDTFLITNVSTGSYILAKTGSHIMAERPCQQSNPSIVLADGTFTILDYSFRSILPASPVVQFIGDSLGIGYDLDYASQIFYQFQNATQVNVVNSCGNGCYIYGMNTTALREIIKNKPKVVVMFHWLSIFYGEYEIGNANNAAYMAQWNGLVGALIGLGIKLVLFKPQSWSLDPGTNCTQWNTFVDDQVAANPGELIACDITDITPTYDASTYHADAVYNIAITARLIDTLGSNDLI